MFTARTNKKTYTLQVVPMTKLIDQARGEIKVGESTFWFSALNPFFLTIASAKQMIAELQKAISTIEETERNESRRIQETVRRTNEEQARQERITSQKQESCYIANCGIHLGPSIHTRRIWNLGTNSWVTIETRTDGENW